MLSHVLSLCVRSCQHQGVYLAAKEGDPDAQLQMKKLLGDKLFPGKATTSPTITVTPPPAARMADPSPTCAFLVALRGTSCGAQESPATLTSCARGLCDGALLIRS